MTRLITILVVVLSVLLAQPLTAMQALAAGPIINVDGPTDSATLNSVTNVLGWAVDRAAANGTGIDTVHMYLDGQAGRGQFLGAADYGLARDDVAQALGSQRFLRSGFNYPFDVSSISSGEHYLYVYARSVKSGWTNVKIKVIIQIDVNTAPPPPAYSYPSKTSVPFLAPPPGLPVAGNNYSYSPSYPPAPPSGYNAPYGAPPASPAWSVAQQFAQCGSASLQWDDAIYMGVGQSSGANLYALLLSPGSVDAWNSQPPDTRYDWTLRTARAFASNHPGQATAFMLMTITIEGAPAPPDGKWSITIGNGPNPGSYQVAQVLAFGQIRPGEGAQVQIRPF